jgi:uncharacterized membrane protein YgcG
MRIGHALHASLALTALAATVPAAAQSLPNRIDSAVAQNGAPRAASKGTILRTIMTTAISVKFDQTKAKDAFAYVRQLLGIDIVVRWSNDPGASDGIDPETPLTFEMNNAQSLVVLERMIEMSTTEPATWQLREGYLEVGTKARLNARGAQATRIYPIRDLLFEAPNFDNAPEFNLNQAVQSGGGGGGGGGNGGGGFGGGGGGGFGGGGGGGGGGSPFGNPGEAPERRSAEEKGDELIELIKSLVEPDVWLDDSVASIRYYDGSIIVRAPDYVQRQIAGYGSISAPPPPKRTGGRYVDVSAPIGVSKVTGFGTSTVTGATGGGSFGGTGSGAGGGTGSPIPGGSTPAAPGGTGAGSGTGTGRKGTSSSTGSNPGSGTGTGNSAAPSGATPPANAPGSGAKP